MKLKTLSLFLVLLGAAFLAGCAADDDGAPPTDTTPPGDDTSAPGDDADPPADPADAPLFTLTATGFPGDIHAGEAFSFTLEIEGEGEVTSDHIGAHYAVESSDVASLDNYPHACAHQEGIAPGTFTVTCTFAEEGNYHLRGHLRLAQGDDTYAHYWSAEHTLVAEADDHDADEGEAGDEPEDENSGEENETSE